MKRILKSRILLVIVTAVVFGSIGVFATIEASNITYNGTTVDLVLDDLYDKAGNMEIATKKFCELKTGTANTVGSMYECDPGDGTKRNFYILAVNNNNTVDMIMQHNITEGTGTTTMTWNNAMKYIDDNNLKITWSNVLDVDLPKAQAIANAVGSSSWIAADSGATWWCLESKQQDTQISPYCYNNDGNLETLWLWDYTRECASWNCQHSLGTTEAFGYWTRDLISNTANAWIVHGYGFLSNTTVSHSTSHGVRPVITVLKSQLSN